MYDKDIYIVAVTREKQHERFTRIKPSEMYFTDFRILYSAGFRGSRIIMVSVKK